MQSILPVTSRLVWRTPSSLSRESATAAGDTAGYRLSVLSSEQLSQRLHMCLSTKQMEQYTDIRNDIEAYVFDVIVPLYKGFDSAHREDHALTVISQAMELLDMMPEGYAEVDREMLFVAAACHDLGLANGRERHHIDSGTIIRSNLKLKEWFSEEQIETIAQAAEDHRASGKAAPRSIYGMLVAEADRVIDGETIIRRTLQFGLTNFPDLDREGHVKRAVEHLKEKYGRGGYMKLWIPWSDNAARLSDFQDIIADAAAVYTATASVYDSLT